MPEFDDTNRGALFRNDKGDNPKRPDYTGEINVEGTDYRLSAWLRESKAGKKYMSLSVQRKEAQRPVETPQEGFSDEIPF